MRHAVIAARSSAVPEICGDAPTFFDPGNMNELADAIVAMERICDAPDAAAAHQKKGMQQSVRYRWENSVDSVWRIFREILAR